mmetsp:Transcript_20330/g.24263  ORF Transcript_20330/g.24263 Transcript_20330/m.24263 type:complete len:310 (+) Transcript_20330:59-988(+)
MTYGTRTLLELSVGKTHTIEVLVHLRTDDLDWWNRDLARHAEQLIKLISRRILPVECRDEIEDYHADRTNWNNGDNQRGVMQTKASTASTMSASASARSKKKRTTGEVISHRSRKNSRMTNKLKEKEATKTGGVGTRSRTSASNSSSFTTSRINGKTSTMKAGNNLVPTKEKVVGANNGRPYASGLDIKFAFGDDDIQVTYKVEVVKTMNSATLSYNIIRDASSCGGGSHNNITKAAKKPSDGKVIKRLSSFRRLEKLPKRIVIWCYPFDPLNPKELTLEKGGGFPRPEMIPISSLFSDKRSNAASLSK